MIDIKHLSYFYKFRRNHINTNSFYVSNLLKSLNISSAFVPQKLLNGVNFGSNINARMT